MNGFSDDIEQVSVRKGCTLTGYDGNNFSGHNAVIRAVGKDR